MVIRVLNIQFNPTFDDLDQNSDAIRHKPAATVVTTPATLGIP
jgi:hypothetical protein